MSNDESISRSAGMDNIPGGDSSSPRLERVEQTQGVITLDERAIRAVNELADSYRQSINMRNKQYKTIVQQAAIMSDITSTDHYQRAEKLKAVVEQTEKENESLRRMIEVRDKRINSLLTIIHNANTELSNA